MVDVLDELIENLVYHEKRIAKKIRKSILCLSCKYCNEGEIVDDYIPMFKCDVFDLKVIGVFGCNDYEKRTRDEITQSKEEIK